MKMLQANSIRNEPEKKAEEVNAFEGDKKKSQESQIHAHTFFHLTKWFRSPYRLWDLPDLQVR